MFKKRTLEGVLGATYFYLCCGGDDVVVSGMLNKTSRIA